jgi:hypothetical protein
VNVGNSHILPFFELLDDAIPRLVEQYPKFAAEARYPGDIEPMIPEDVALAIEIAEGVVEGARVQIREVPGTR